MKKTQVITNNPNTQVIVLDEPDPQAGGACHKYAVTDNKGNVLLEINFQHGPVQENGVNGVQHTDLLAIIQHRLDSFQKGPFASAVNEVTAGFIGAALASERTRTRRRTLAGVEGKNIKASGVEE